MKHLKFFIALLLTSFVNIYSAPAGAGLATFTGKAFLYAFKTQNKSHGDNSSLKIIGKEGSSTAKKIIKTNTNMLAYDDESLINYFLYLNVTSDNNLGQTNSWENNYAFPREFTDKNYTKNQFTPGQKKLHLDAFIESYREWGLDNLHHQDAQWFKKKKESILNITLQANQLMEFATENCPEMPRSEFQIHCENMALIMFQLINAQGSQERCEIIESNATNWYESKQIIETCENEMNITVMHLGQTQKSFTSKYIY